MLKDTQEQAMRFKIAALLLDLHVCTRRPVLGRPARSGPGRGLAVARTREALPGASYKQFVLSKLRRMSCVRGEGDTRSISLKTSNEPRDGLLRAHVRAC